jgi:hypothetical protein
MTKNITKHASNFGTHNNEIYVDSTISWKIHIEKIMHKLSAACYVMRSVKPFMSQETLMMVYYAYFHSIMNYGLLFWGNSSCM